MAIHTNTYVIFRAVGQFTYVRNYANITFVYTVVDDGFKVHFVSNDNYLNAIHSTVSLSLFSKYSA